MKKIFGIILCLILIESVQAQRDLQYKWSVTAEYGLCNLDGDGDSWIRQAFGASVEYAFLPFAGVSVDYYHFPLAGPTFTTQLNSADINFTLNINRLLFSTTDYKVILKGYIGYGIAGYTSTYLSTPVSSRFSTYNSTTSFPVLAVSVEYYLNRFLSVGAKSQFRPFSVNNLEGDPRYNQDNVNTDNLVAATLYLRVKFARDN